MPVYTVKSGDLDVVINKRTVKTAAKFAVSSAAINTELGIFTSISEIGKEEEEEYVLTIPLLLEMGNKFEFIKEKGYLSVR